MQKPYVDSLLTRFVDTAAEKGFVILIDPDDPAQFVQFMRRGGTIYAEVSSRQWGSTGAARRLADSNELALMRTGFTHGGGPKNYAQDGLSADGPFLAEISRHSYLTAYGQALPERPIVVSNVDGVNDYAVAAGGCVQPVSPPNHDKRGFFCPICETVDAFMGTEQRTGPGLLVRARRAVRSNFVLIHLDCEEHVVLVEALERARQFDELPEQVQDWILKSEEGPLFP